MASHQASPEQILALSQHPQLGLDNNDSLMNIIAVDYPILVPSVIRNTPDPTDQYNRLSIALRQVRAASQEQIFSFVVSFLKSSPHSEVKSQYRVRDYLENMIRLNPAPHILQPVLKELLPFIADPATLIGIHQLLIHYYFHHQDPDSSKQSWNSARPLITSYVNEYPGSITTWNYLDFALSGSLYFDTPDQYKQILAFFVEKHISVPSVLVSLTPQEITSLQLLPFHVVYRLVNSTRSEYDNPPGYFADTLIKAGLERLIIDLPVEHLPTLHHLIKTDMPRAKEYANKLGIDLPSFIQEKLEQD